LIEFLCALPSNALQRDGSKYIVVQLPGQAGAPVFPECPGAATNGFADRPNITRIDPNIETSYGEQMSLEIERELPGRLRSQWLSALASSAPDSVAQCERAAVPASAGVPNLGRPIRIGAISRARKLR
jgi:hypothetical protein